MDLIKLIPSSVSKNYLYCALQYGGYSEQIAPLANGVNVLHLKPEAMMKMEMLVPDENTIRTFDVQFEAVRLKIEALEKQCDLAVQARDRLLPKLMSGELEV
jgi:type I restriction enzyme S subunit